MSEPGFKPGLLILSSWFFPQQQYIPEIWDPKWMLEIISSKNDRYILNDMPTLVVLDYPERVLRTGEHHRLSGESAMTDSLVPLGRPPGLVLSLSQLSSLPPFVQMGKSMLARFKSCPQAHSSIGRAMVSPHLSWTLYLMHREALRWSPSPESSWEACQITPLRISSWPCFSVSCQIVASSEQTALKRNAMWNASLRYHQWDCSVKVFVEQLLRGTSLQVMDEHGVRSWDWMSKKGEWSRKNQSQLSI